MTYHDGSRASEANRMTRMRRIGDGVARHPALAIAVAMICAAVVGLGAQAVGWGAGIKPVAPVAGGVLFGWLASRSQRLKTTRGSTRGLVILLVVFGSFLAVLVIGMLVSSAIGAGAS